MSLPAVYKRHVDSILSERLEQLEVNAITGFMGAQSQLVSALCALAEIRDTQAWREITIPTQWGELVPMYERFEQYLTDFVNRLVELHPTLNISLSFVAERLRWHRRFVLGMGFDAEKVLTAPAQTIRNLESMAEFDRKTGELTGITDGLNKDALPSSVDDSEEKLREIVEATLGVYEERGARESLEYTKSVLGVPEIIFQKSGDPKKPTGVIWRHRAEEKAREEYAWREEWPKELVEEYERRLQVR